MAFYDPTPFSHYYGNTVAGSGVVGVDKTIGRLWIPHWPGKVIGVACWNAILGDPTIRVGLWDYLGNLLASGEKDNCSVGRHVIEFDDLYEVTWDIINKGPDGIGQAIGGIGRAYYVGYWNTAGASYTDFAGVSGKVIIGLGNTGWLGASYGTANNTEGQLSSGNGWGPPDGVPAEGAACDPFIIPTLVDDYDPLAFPHTQGADHPDISLQTGSNITVGAGFQVMRIGAKVWGVRFYTHDPNPWDAKCSFWDSTAGGALQTTKTISCSGRGIYDALFASPVTITEAMMSGVAGFPTDTQHVGVYNTTNTNWTAVTTQQYARFPNTQGQGFAGQFARMSNGAPNELYPNSFILADAEPTNAALAHNYPIIPLVTGS